MAKYVPDATTKRWVIIAPTRGSRPHDSEKKDHQDKPKQSSESSEMGQGSHQYTTYSHTTPRQIQITLPHPSVHPQTTCPFCVGNEFMTPPEVYRLGDGEPNTPGWTVRVVPNKFPITDIHEVIIHGPSCCTDIESLPVEQVSAILRVYRNRFRTHNAMGHVMIFCNHGFQAGASLKHPHSQLVVVPRQITLDALSIEPIANTVDQTDNFVSYCPEFSQWPMETWIAPRKTQHSTYANLHGEELNELALLLGNTLRKIEKVLRTSEYPFAISKNEPFVYNYYISHSESWFIRITPRLIYRAGFELGTGLSVNIIDPENAAEYLQKA